MKEHLAIFIAQQLKEPVLVFSSKYGKGKFLSFSAALKGETIPTSSKSSSNKIKSAPEPDPERLTSKRRLQLVN